MTYHTQPVKLVCHHCGHQQKIHFACPKCQAKMHALGLGTQRIEQALAVHFPDIPILRIDRDSTSRKNSFEEMLDQVHQGHPQILLGTQMVAKGHHFPQVTMVGVLNADGGLYSADFRAAEHIAQLIMQVAGRAGRAEHPGEVYVQTYWPDHPIWQNLVQEKGYELFMHSVLRQREVAFLPPFRFAAIVRAEGKHPDLPQNFLSFAAERARAVAQPGIAVLGPINALHAKRAGFYRAQLLLISSSRFALHALLKDWVPMLAKDKQSHLVRWHVDVDPLEFD
jgi:primosomal protein N' (replication factor Y)